MKFTLFVVSLLAILIQNVAQAEFFEKDQMYIYKVRPYSEVLSDEELIQFTAQISHVALVSVMESMVETKLFPSEIANVQDIEKLRKANKDVEILVAYLNRLVDEQREQNSEFSLPDVVPDAFMVFGGKKLSLNIGGGVGGSISLGVILMPVYVEQYSQRSGELVDDYFSVKAAVVGWTNGDVGFGVGGGTGVRIGVGAIWDLNDAYTRPDQFWGAGLGASWTPLTVGAGVNAKVGFLSNWDMPGWLDFAYLTAGLEIGATAEISSPRLNLTSFFSGAKIMSLLESSQRKAFEAALRELSKKMDMVFIEINKNNDRAAMKEKEGKAELNESEELAQP